MAGESKFVKDQVRPDLAREFPGSRLIKQDPGTSFQGIPDYLFVWGSHWAALETKAALNAKKQPNQSYYIDEFDGMSFAAFACPENWQEVLRDMKEAFSR